MKSIAFVVLALAGCGTSSTSEPYAPEQVTTGIYTLTSTADVDTCDPPRYTGSGARVTVIASPGTLQLQDFLKSSTATWYPTFTLAQDTGYAWASPGLGEEGLTCAQPAGGQGSVAYTLVDAAQDQLDVVEDEAWTIPVPCAERTVSNVTVIPSASCQATRRLHYALVTACAPPCSIVDMPDGSGLGPTCHCSQ